MEKRRHLLNSIHELIWPGPSIVDGLISLETNVITNLYHSGNYHPQSCIKNVFLRPKKKKKKKNVLSLAFKAASGISFYD